MTTFTLPVLSASSSRAEEINFLRKLTEKLSGSQTYLEMLFTSELVEYFENELKTDSAPDMCGCAKRQICHRTFIAQAFEFTYGIRSIPLTPAMVSGMVNLGQMLAEGN